MENELSDTPAVGVIGGSDLSEIEGFEGGRDFVVETPFGMPSDAISGGTLHGRPVYFLSRRGRRHTIAPHEINHRANIHALRLLGVRWLVSVSAVGSLQEKYAPGDIVLPAQFYDRTSARAGHTFFGAGIVAHVSFAEPISAHFRTLLAQTCSASRKSYHSGGTYVCIDGPAFSTRAESESYRQAGYDVIGMTNLAETKLAREAEIAPVTMAMIADYDGWKTGENPMTALSAESHVQANAATAKEVISRVIARIPATPDWPDHRSLDGAIVTPREYWPQETLDNLRVLLDRFR